MYMRKILGGLTEQEPLRKFRRRHDRELSIEMMMAEGMRVLGKSQNGVCDETGKTRASQ